MLIYGTVSAEHRAGSLEGPTEVSFFEPYFSSLQLKGDFYFYLGPNTHHHLFKEQDHIEIGSGGNTILHPETTSATSAGQ